MKTISCIMVLLLILGLACSKKAEQNEEILTIEDLLVKNNEITGWSYDGAGWVANNITELTTIINGGAENYSEHGLVKAANQKYEGTIDNDVRQLSLTIYDQGSEPNALATYEDPDLGFSGAEVWVDGAGQAAHYIRHGLSQELAFYRGSYYVHLNMLYDTEESLNILKQFAWNIDGKIQ